MRQCASAIKIDAETYQHADPGGCKASMPSIVDGEGPANERREKCSNIDADVEDRVSAVAPTVFRPIEIAHLAGNVRLERSDADYQHQQGEEEWCLKRHHEMTRCHENAADDDGASL